jgi:hypothetical protein
LRVRVGWDFRYIVIGLLKAAFFKFVRTLSFAGKVAKIEFLLFSFLLLIFGLDSFYYSNILFVYLNGRVTWCDLFKLVFIQLII